MNFDVRLYMARAQIVGLARPPPLVPPLHSRLRLQPPREDGAEEAVASVPCRCELQAATRLERRVEALGWAQLEVGAVLGGEGLAQAGAEARRVRLPLAIHEGVVERRAEDARRVATGHAREAMLGASAPSAAGFAAGVLTSVLAHALVRAVSGRSGSARG